MALAFKVMKDTARDPRRVEIIVPGYTCYSVPAAVERAGLVPRLCDVDPDTLSPDLASLANVDFDRVLAIVSANLYGLPNALQDIEELARRHGVLMLDDAAQALGAGIGGRAAGSFGDVGIWSFDKGKNITTLQGGVLSANAGPLSQSLAGAVAALPGAGAAATLTTLAKLPAYSVLLRPALYGAVRLLPLGLGLTPYETNYPITRFSRALAGLAASQFERLASINGQRIANAVRLREALSQVHGIRIPSVLAGAEAVYARFPLLVDRDLRRRLVGDLVEAGIGATTSYPRALADVPEVARLLPRDQAPTPGAREVADRIVTLPTHAYCPSSLPQLVAAIAAGALADSRNSEPRVSS
jgi:dTDP-4-amino-4,6-dideoxygalactose transaminase